MKTLLSALASAALLAAPMAASAHGFVGGGHAGFGGFASHASAPAFRGGGRFGGGPSFARNYGGGYRWAVGGILPALYWDAYLSDPFDYGLDAAPIGYHWVDVGGQALLIQDGTGAVVQVVDL